MSPTSSSFVSANVYKLFKFSLHANTRRDPEQTPGPRFNAPGVYLKIGIFDPAFMRSRRLIVVRRLGVVLTYPEICENANFFYEYSLRPHVSSVFSGRIRKFLKTLSRVEIFLSDTNTYTCGQSYPEIFEYVIRHSVGSSLHGEHYKQTWRTARL